MNESHGGPDKLAAWNASPWKNKDCALGVLPAFSKGYDAGYNQALSDLKREIEQDRRDAERYRWLREQKRSDYFYDRAPNWSVAYESGGVGHVVRLEKLDAKIDAAIAAQKEGS